MNENHPVQLLTSISQKKDTSLILAGASKGRNCFQSMFMDH